MITIAGNWFPYDRYDRCDRWTFFFSAIAAIIAIVAITWKPGLREDNKTSADASVHE